MKTTFTFVEAVRLIHIPTLVTVTMVFWFWNALRNAELSRHTSMAFLSFTMMVHLCRQVNKENFNNKNFVIFVHFFGFIRLV